MILEFWFDYFLGVTAHADLDPVPTIPSIFMIGLTWYYAECFAMISMISLFETISQGTWFLVYYNYFNVMIILKVVRFCYIDYWQSYSPSLHDKNRI